MTSLTAWELLFRSTRRRRERWHLARASSIVGAGGGASGSILTQLARRLTRLTVIGTASRPETRQWVTDLGAHHVVDHTRPLAAELTRIGVGTVAYVASLTHTEKHYDQLIEALAPQGSLGLIDDPKQLDAVALKLHKSLSLRRS